MLRGDAEGVDVGALGRDPELEAAVRLDPPGEVLRRGPRHPAPQADRLRGEDIVTMSLLSVSDLLMLKWHWLVPVSTAVRVC